MNDVQATVGKSLLTRYVVEPFRNVLNSYDPNYLRTFPGIVKVGILFVNIIAWVSGLIVACYSCRSVHTFTFVSGFAFWLTLAFILIYCFQIDSRFQTVPWIFVDLVYCGLWFVLYLIVSIIVMFNKAVIVGLFGIIAVGLYAYDASLSFKKFKTERETMTSNPNAVV